MGGALGFTDIAKVVDATLSAHSGRADPTLTDVLEADASAREEARGRIAAPAAARRR
jgi:1-deoxy-D-xylulose 5-phosphate reductoisomerase